MKQRALFLDRDGTLVHPRHYPSQPEELVLYEDIAPELRSLQAVGFRLVVITNQAGIARGYFTEADLQRMHDYLRENWRAWGYTWTRFIIVRIIPREYFQNWRYAVVAGSHSLACCYGLLATCI